MANINTQDKEAARQESIEQGVSRTQEFLEKNKKVFYIAGGIILALALIILAYNKFIYQPKCAEAQEQAFPAELNFQKGEFELALNGDGNVLGFADVIDSYGAKAGKAVYMYAGVCELQLGNYENALSYLKKYNGREPVLAARAKACQGDAYVGLGNYSAAVKCFEDAASASDNVLAAGYLIKAGLAYEKLGQNDKALECYKAVQDRYPQSMEAYDVERYISRVAE